jgi:predicted permease
VDTLLHDVRYAIRGLIKTPVFTLGVVLTLALGIGINATMFGVVDTLFLRAPAGVKDPEQIVRVFFRQDFGTMGLITQPSTGYPSFLDIRNHTPAFSRVAAMYVAPVGLGRGSDAIRVTAAMVSHEFFQMLGLAPALGRFFDSTEDRPDGEHVAVLGYAFWLRQYGGDPAVVGRTLTLGNGSYTVVGIAPKGFAGINIQSGDLFLPIAVAGEEFMGNGAIGPTQGRWWSWLEVVARLRPIATREAAAAQATLAFRQGKSNTPGFRAEYRDSTSQVLLGAIQEARAPDASSDARVALWIGVVAAIVLLIACANVANLLLARGVSRRRELAVRASLGAGRSGLIRALLTESLILAVAGGLSAVVLAVWVAGAARSFLLPDLSKDVPLIDPRVLAFTGIAVAITALLTGLVPAIHASRTDLVAALKSGGHGATMTGGRTRAALLVMQIALTLVLLVGAGLFVRSLRHAQAIDLGLDADRVLSVRMDLAGAGFTGPDANDVYLRLLDRVAQMPGIERAAVSMGTPFGFAYASALRAEGRDSMPQVKSGGPYFQAITPGYLQTLGTRITSGRDFTPEDAHGREPVAIVGVTFARRVWPGQSAVGKCLYRSGNHPPGFKDTVSTCTRVVGVAADAKRGEVTETETLLYYLPFAQYDKPAISALFVRMRPGARGLPAALQREVQGAGNLPFAKIESLADQVAPQLRSWQLGASAFTAFGLLALLIAATGIFAVLSYGVSQRTKEIGVRVALGAQSAHVVRMIVGHGLRAALVGVAIGVVGAYALGRAIASLLYQVPAADPLVFGGVTVVLLTVALAAAYLPARRASRIAPMIALRSE